MFKKLFIICICLVSLLSCYAINSTPVFSAYADKYEVYFSEYSSLKSVWTVNKTGYLLCLNKKGESCAVDKQISARQILDEFDADIVKIEKHSEGTSIYAYSNKIKYKKRMFGKIVNLHIEVNDNQMRVGSPIIYGSF